MPLAPPATPTIELAPGVVVVVRDEQWLVTEARQTPDGWRIEAQGLSELVRDTTATFYATLDRITVLDPRNARVIGDDSPGYRRARLWLEATLRKQSMPLDHGDLTVAPDMLADSLDYQLSAVRRALDPAKLRPRILLADAVGLGKTLEIGMILSELVRRGRGDRILIVSPRHVLEQMQHEMWSRFALPFVRLDSIGIQRIRQKLPATRNPFAYYRRIIVSIDTLKSDRYAAHLRNQRWDAVVIDESHNVTNSGTQNHRLASILAPNTDALILASATPHNGKPESFAELIRLLEPTAVSPDGTLNEDELKRIVIRRHRGSPEVATQVGAEWAPRAEPNNLTVPASEPEDAVANELATIWLHPTGRPPYSGGRSQLFPWTLAKAFLSSPAALAETIRERRRRLHKDTAAGQTEDAALARLADLNDQVTPAASAKYQRLLDYLRGIGISRTSPMRAVVFAERVATLTWLQENLTRDLALPPAAVEILHGGLTDVDQQDIVESFKQASSPIRILVTGDVASEGVNLHLQCHELIHFDIPWSLIRIEQRNGRIDRYGQRHSPRITTLLLHPSSIEFSGDLRVFTRLMEKERQAHDALGDAASLMGKYDVEAEESALLRVLTRQQDFDEVVQDVADVSNNGGVAGLLARLTAGATPGSTQPHPTQADPGPARTQATAHNASLYPTEAAFLLEALYEAYPDPGVTPSAGGVALREYRDQSIIELTPPKDLIARLEVLPQTYLSERKVTQRLALVTTPARGRAVLADALANDDDSTWPEAHYLGPLHPVLDWAADKVLAAGQRGAVFAIRGTVDEVAVALAATLTNKSGHVVSLAFLAVHFPAGPTGFTFVEDYPTAADLFASLGVTASASNPGAVDTADLDAFIAPAVDEARNYVKGVLDAASNEADARARAWADRVNAWESEASGHVQTQLFKDRRVSVEEERRLAEAMRPDRQLVRPLLVVMPPDAPVAAREDRA